MCTIVVMGEIGSGKTLLGLKLVEMMNYHMKLSHVPGARHSSTGLHIYASSQSAGTELASFNAFRPILQAVRPFIS